MLDNKQLQRFEATENALIVFANYREKAGCYVLTHVEAAPALRGTGAAARLMQAIVDQARAEQLKLIPVCSYAVAWFRRHPEAFDVTE